MSLPADKFACTGCSYQGLDPKRSIRLIYRLRDGFEFRVARSFGWCPVCKDMRDIEPRLDRDEIRARLVALEAQTRRLSFVVEDEIRRLLNRPRSDLREEIEDLLGQLAIAEARQSAPRCLECRSQGALEVEFDDNNLSGNFVHECGGRLKRMPGDWSGTRFSYDLEMIFLDEEGRRLPGFQRSQRRLVG